MKSSTDVEWRWQALWLLCGITLFRIVYNSFLYSFDLSGDEAYYWEWGRRLDWGYFSKPPLIGWIMGLLHWLRLDFSGGIRDASALIGTGLLTLIFFTAQRLFSARAAFWAMLLSLSTIGNAALNICMTTDVLLSTCWVAGLLSFWNLMERPSLGRAALFVICMGAGTLSKQMMWVFFPLAVIFLAVCPEKRALLKRPWFWLCGVLPILFNIPEIIWNARHDWITFRHTGQHFNSEPFSIVNAVSQTSEFIGTQAGLVTPVIFVLLLTVLIGTAREWKRLSAEMRYLFVFSGPPLVGFLLFSFYRDVHPNWPLVFYLPALILVGGFCTNRNSRFETWMKRGIYSGISLVILFYITMATLSLRGSDVSRIAPLREVSGWSKFAKEVARVQKNLPDKDTTIIVAGHRYYTAELAFYHPDRPRVYNWNNHSGVNHQYDLWSWKDSFSGNALIVVSGGYPISAELATCFESVEPLGKITAPENARKPKTGNLYYAKGWISENTQ